MSFSHISSFSEKMVYNVSCKLSHYKETFRNTFFSYFQEKQTLIFDINCLTTRRQFTSNIKVCFS